MSIKLTKGSTLNLTKKEPSLEKIMIGLGWDMKTSNKLDLDVSMFMIGKNGKLISDEYLVFYNNLKSPDGSAQHLGDNRTGDGDGDDEMVLVNLATINPEVTELILAVTIHDAEIRRHNFGLLKDAYIRILDVKTDRQILIYDLDEEFPTDTDVEFGRLVKQNNEWSFVASGVGGKEGLQGYVDRYA